MTWCWVEDLKMTWMTDNLHNQLLLLLWRCTRLSSLAGCFVLAIDFITCRAMLVNCFWSSRNWSAHDSNHSSPAPAFEGEKPSAAVSGDHAGQVSRAVSSHLQAPQWKLCAGGTRRAAHHEETLGGNLLQRLQQIPGDQESARLCPVAQELQEKRVSGAPIEPAALCVAPQFPCHTSRTQTFLHLVAGVCSGATRTAPTPATWAPTCRTRRPRSLCPGWRPDEAEESEGPARRCFSPSHNSIFSI